MNNRCGTRLFLFDIEYCDWFTNIGRYRACVGVFTRACRYQYFRNHSSIGSHDTIIQCHAWVKDDQEIEINKRTSFWAVQVRVLIVDDTETAKFLHVNKIIKLKCSDITYLKKNFVINFLKQHCWYRCQLVCNGL